MSDQCPPGKTVEEVIVEVCDNLNSHMNASNTTFYLHCTQLIYDVLLGQYGIPFTLGKYTLDVIVDDSLGVPSNASPTDIWITYDSELPLIASTIHYL